MACGAFMNNRKKIPAIILAGGFGTRLQKVVSDRPKPMALIQGKPFLEYLLSYLGNSGVISEIILSVGYLHEQIESYFSDCFLDLPIRYSIEDSPLGTGGAISKAIVSLSHENCFIFNGDTMFSVDLNKMIIEHAQLNADVTIALKMIRNIDRYGTVICEKKKIVSFEEKRAIEKGFINGGIYIIRKNALVNCLFPAIYSLEKDFLQKYVSKLHMIGVKFNDYFIDIGIPEDFERAQSELKLLGV
jgi:D-glycero-alpha-D-manno-heptose 1-phosphate guanylyltransferase